VPTISMIDTIPGGGNTWEVAKLRRHDTTGLATYGTTRPHTLKLDGNTLHVTEELRLTGANRQYRNLLIENGTLRIGTDEENLASIELASGQQLLTLGSSVTLEPYIHTIGIAPTVDWATHSSILDLRGAQLATQFNRTLTVKRLLFRFAEWDTQLVMDDQTAIDTLDVTESLLIGSDFGTYLPSGPTARIGSRENWTLPSTSYQTLGLRDDPNDWRLPTGMNVIVGDKDNDLPGTLYIGRKSGSVNAALIPDGGDFTAYLNEFQVGIHYGTSGNAFGLLDLRDVGNWSLEATTAAIGGTAGSGVDGRGEVYLPTGTASVGALEIGNQPLGTGSGYLELDGTDFQIASSLTVRKGGHIFVNVNGESCGIDLQGDTFTMESGSLITINFTQDQQTPNGVYYGLKWSGEHAGELGAFSAAGKLAWTMDPAIEGKRIAVIEEGGDTYVALVDATILQPPVAAAKDATRVLLGDSVSVTALEIDDNSYDPNELEIVSYKLSYGA